MKISLLQLSLIISLFGIFLLLLFSNILKPKQIKIQEINNKLLNKNIEISGQITEIKAFEESNFQVITLKDETASISITIDKIINLSQNQNIQVIGKITEYQGELQVQANKIVSAS
tara:strand:+ start:633 stop:980 length:348 start_codon:yes stop_codon:yes gene_type:complete